MTYPDESFPKKRKNKEFTTEEKETILRLNAEGLSLKQIGQQMKRSSKYMSIILKEAGIELRICGQFQKGLVPANRKEIGTTVMDTEGYWKIKVGENKWEFLHRHVWVTHHGAIPKGHVVAFINGNRSDCSIENLYVTTKAALATKNSQKEQSRQRRSVAMKTHYEASGDNFGSKRLSTAYIQGIVKKRKLPICPETVALTRAHILLKRTIKKHLKQD